MESAQQQLASVHLGRPVADWITERRSEGASWRAMTWLLYEDTGHRVMVTHETLRNWDRDR